MQVVKNKNFNEKSDQSPFDIKYLNNENVSKPGVQDKYIKKKSRK